MEWEEFVDDEERGRHRYDLDCDCQGCHLLRWRKETHRHSKQGAYSSYRGQKHDDGDNLIKGRSPKEKRSKPSRPVKRKKEKQVLAEEDE